MCQPPKLKRQPAFKEVLEAIEEYVQALEDEISYDGILDHEQNIRRKLLESTIGAEGYDYIERLKDTL